MVNVQDSPGQSLAMNILLEEEIETAAAKSKIHLQVDVHINAVLILTIFTQLMVDNGLKHLYGF